MTGSEMIDEAVVVEHLCKSYTVEKTVTETLHDVSFSLPKFTITSVIGHNGAGKTTLLEILAGIRKPSSGNAWVLGRPANLSAVSKDGSVAYLPQHLELFSELTVSESIGYYCDLNGNKMSPGDLVSRFNLGEHGSKRYSNLSGGLKRRTAIACILAADPDIVILDEPSSGLDPQSRSDLWNILLSVRDSGKTVILTSHEVSEAIIRSDNILVMNSGRLKYSGPPSGLPLKLRVRLRGEYHLDGFVSEYGHGTTSFYLEDHSQLSDLTGRLSRMGVQYNTLAIDYAEDLIL